MGDQLEAQLKRLGHASSVFRRQAAVGVFALLGAKRGVGGGGGASDAAQDAALRVLCDRHPVSAVALGFVAPLLSSRVCMLRL